MSHVAHLIEMMQFSRTRTLGTLAAAEKEAGALGWRPGPGRAHIAWQLMHVGVTEELFATERLNPSKPAKYSELWPRFRGGSTPDDVIPSPEEIRSILESSRASLLETLSAYDDSRLGEKPEAFAARGWTMLDVLHVICWHEVHHQGQAHITLNLFKNRPA